MNVRADQLYVFKAVIIVVIIVVSCDVFKENFRKLTRKTFGKNIQAEG
jgi:hypothetical protein